MRVSYTRSNITPTMRRTMLSQVASPLSREELGHFQDIFKAGRFISADGATDYLESLSTLDVPLLDRRRERPRRPTRFGRRLDTACGKQR